jgi:hypothetical protein
MLMTAGILGGMAVTEVLIFNIYGTLDTVYSPPLSHLFEMLRIFKFDFLEYISFSCIIGTNSTVAMYVFKLLIVPFGFVMLLGGLALFSVVRPLRPLLSIDKDALVNSLGLLFSMFFVAVCSTSLDGFMCSGNPNGKMTLTSDPAILCWEGDEHLAYVFLSVVAILIYPISFLTFSGFIVYNYDVYVMRGGPGFIKRVRFLVARMNPDFRIFAFWYNIRNFALALMPVLLSSNYSLQVISLLVISLTWLLAQMQLQPWRFPILNLFDAFSSSVNLVLLSCFTMLAGRASMNAEQVGWIIVIVFLLAVLTLMIACAWKFCSRFFRSKEYSTFICHAKTAAGLTARLLKLMLAGLNRCKSFLDVDELENLDNLSFTVRTNVANLLILATETTFHRFWCALEITCAVMNNVPIVVACAAQRGDPTESLPPVETLNSVSDIFAPIDLAELHKLGVTAQNVEAAYKWVARLAVIDIPYLGSFDCQLESVAQIQRCLGACPYRSIQVAPELGQSACIVYDIASNVQSCVAHIMHILLKNARWMAGSLYLQMQVKNRWSL